MRGMYWVASGVALLLVTSGQADAIDERVRHACSGDYAAFCSAYQVGSEALRQCMRKADKKLSPGCIDALVAAGEVSGAEVKRRRASAQ